MAKEICISTTPHETRLAILEDDQLAEIYYERENEYTLAGSIYKGRVTRVLPGMQSSFVDVGLERDAFLYVTDFLEEQEDSEEYTSDGNGKSREPRSGREPGEEPADRAAGADRNGADRQERSPDRNQDRGGRRPAVAAVRTEAGREPGRESGRAGRERAREQAVAPLREAVPAAQDLEEKGDAESPEGTRRWRGRRGRRRGVRAGLPASPPPSPLSDTPQALEEAGTAEEAAPLVAADHVSISEDAASGGIEALHASPAQADSAYAKEPARQAERSRDRGPRRPREPYAQVSTLDRPARGLEPPYVSAPSLGPAAGASSTGSIVLPGESLSKYGSAPADPSVAAAAATTTVPRTQRPVNYVAPKPSTLVEFSGGWDGGAVMPGESLSRYRDGSAPVTSSIALAASASYLEAVETAAPSMLGLAAAFEPLPAVEGLEQEAPVDEAPLPQHAQAAAERAPAFEPGDAPGGMHEQPAEPEHASSGEFAALAEPEIVSAAVAPELEAPPVHVPEPEITHAPEPAEAAQEPAREEASHGDAAEYEPENASASYRVQPAAPSELRLPSPEAEEPPVEIATTPDHAAAAWPAFAEPAGHFSDAAQALTPEPLSLWEEAHEPEPVPEFGGALTPEPAFESQAEPAGEFEPSTAHTPDAPPLQILHDDGSIDLAAAHEPGLSYPALPEPHGSEFDAGEDEPPATHVSGQSSDDASQAATQPADLHPSSFADLVDRMQGFAPGSGLLEEETIDEEEYDFEPLHAHAHAEDGDQEDLEEETLDQNMEPSALGDAVRESHLDQRIHQAPQAAASTVEEEEAGFGYEEVEEGEDDFEGAEEGEEPAQAAQPGEPQRGGRGEEGRGRGRGRSNGGRRNGPGHGRGRFAQSQDLPIISELLKQGQEILVQIAKEPIAKKGARITSHIALPGRFLVFMPTVSHVGVSRKIASDEERQRLKRILISEKGDSSGGFIVRTAAEGASEEDLRADLRFLISLWTEIKQRSETAKAPALIYHDLNLIERILRDQVSSNFSTIWVDSEAEYERIIRFLSRFQPQLVRRVKLYTKETPLFEHFGIQEEISKALKSKVWLKSGGSIVINQTEALVAIDINTGKYVGKTSRLEDTIVKTNLDAIPEIVRQIRLRDLGGIIVIDFIDMDERKNRNRVLAALEEELKNDRAPSKVLQFNDFGLVAITRKRVKQSLERTLSVTCETCTGTGMVKSPITVCNEIYTEMRKMQKHLDGKDVMLRVNPEVVKQLKANNGKWINELEEMVTKTIIIKSDPALHPEQFDIH